MKRAYKRRNRRIRRLKGMSYSEYLQSEEWKELRQTILKRDNGKCLLCGGIAQNVHHTSYSVSVLSNKSGWALFSLCRYCHRFVEFDEERKVNMTEMRRRMIFLAKRHKTISALADRGWQHCGKPSLREAVT